MSKVTYLLIQSARGAYPSPLAVCGASSMNYGHAEYDPAHDAHVYRFTQEEWEGGIDRDIAENKHRSYGKWIVRAEVEPDLESPEGQHAQEVDSLKARIAELEITVAQLHAFKSGLEIADEKPPLPPLDSLPPVDPVTPTLPPVSAPDISEMGFDDLDYLMKSLNRDGANIQIEGQPSKVKLRKAIGDHYAQAA